MNEESNEIGRLLQEEKRCQSGVGFAASRGQYQPPDPAGSEQSGNWGTSFLGNYDEINVAVA
jgi:hypothetical protein